MSIIVTNGIPFKTDLVINGKRQWGLLLEVLYSEFTTGEGTSKVTYNTQIGVKNYNACKIDVKNFAGKLTNNAYTELSADGIITIDQAELSEDFQDPNNKYFIYIYYLENEA